MYVALRISRYGISAKYVQARKDSIFFLSEQILIILCTFMYIAARIFICIAAMALPPSRQCFMCTIHLRVCTIRFRVCAIRFRVCTIRKNIVLLRSPGAPVSYLRFASNDR